MRFEVKSRQLILLFVLVLFQQPTILISPAALVAQETPSETTTSKASSDGQASQSATATSPGDGSAAEKSADASPWESARQWEQRIDDKIGLVLEYVVAVPFYNVGPWIGVSEEAAKDSRGQEVLGPTGEPAVVTVPFVVVWLIVGAVFFTLRMRFVNLRLFRHALSVVRGKYSDPQATGEVTHFQALSAALSATVGLGNIAGVAIAVSLGGPGATFWMIVAGFLGMSLKFTECTLGQMYRHVDEQGHVSGGPMHYLKDGLARQGLAGLGVPLSILFAIFCIGGSVAGGNAFQVFQSKSILADQVPFFQENGWVYGVVMAVLVGIVIIGGIRRIAHTAEAIVPVMCGVYVIACLCILGANVGEIPAALGVIFGSAFSGEAMYGGAIGALVMGFRRAAFSNEAGVGSASIAHSAARTPYPVREGVVALLEPFIDTIVVCTMTALVIVITGVYNAPEHAELVSGKHGAALTNAAFKTVPALAGWFPWVLLSAVVLFAFSTMISWSYYGERCWTNLFGPRSSLAYKFLFLFFVFLGSVMSGKNALEFGDLMILLMALPNVFGLYFLSGEVRRALDAYEADYRAGKFVPAQKQTTA